MASTALTKSSTNTTALTRDDPVIVEIATRIRDRTGQFIYDTGRDLNDAKSRLGHGQWLPFLVDLGIEARTAQNYMSVAVAELWGKLGDDGLRKAAYRGR
ncbi:MAG: hypothetical protein P4N59_30415 [Negativicutes bacterium]|nr:hypothetical protein [Negativicutes bacterium]